MHSRCRQVRINKLAGTLIFAMAFWRRIARIQQDAGKALCYATCRAAAVTSLTTMARCVAAEAAESTALQRDFPAVLTRSHARTCAQAVTTCTLVAQQQTATGKIPSWMTTTNAAAKL